MEIYKILNNTFLIRVELLHKKIKAYFQFPAFGFTLKSSTQAVRGGSDSIDMHHCKITNNLIDATEQSGCTSGIY